MAEPDEVQQSRYWKLLLHFDQTLMAKPRANHIASEMKTQSAEFDARLGMFFRSEWEELLDHAKDDGDQDHDLPPLTRLQQMQKRKTRVAVLSMMNEKGRTLAATKQVEPPMLNPDLLPELQALFPTAEVPARPTVTDHDMGAAEAIGELAAKLFR